MDGKLDLRPGSVCESMGWICGSVKVVGGDKQLKMVLGGGILKEGKGNAGEMTALMLALPRVSCARSEPGSGLVLAGTCLEHKALWRLWRGVGPSSLRSQMSLDKKQS